MLSEKEEALLRLALDAAAAPGEADNAAVALIRSMRRRGASAYDRGEFSIPKAKKAKGELKREDWPGSMVLDFGKHNGKALGEVPCSYLRWIAREFKDQEDERHADLYRAAVILLEDLERRYREPNL